MKRRSFLQTSASIGAGVLAAPYVMTAKPKANFLPTSQLGFEDNDNIIIIIELFGGNDGLNTIYPAESDKLHELRPFALSPDDSVLIENGLGLYYHPALVNGIGGREIVDEGFKGLGQTGRLAVIEGVGYEKMTMSHFRSRDIWHSGINSKDPNVQLLDGWLGRYLASKMENYPEVVPDDPIAITMGGTTPLLLKSPKGDMGISLINPELFYNQGKGLKPPYPTLDGNSDFVSENNFLHTVGLQSEKYSQSIYDAFQKGKNSVNYDMSSPFESKFATIAKLIDGGIKSKIFYVGLSNFDSHVNEQIGVEEGQHNKYLAQLSQGISNFMKDASNLGFEDRISGYTFSEFGRRAKQNGSRGTDHGAGSMMFVFGHFDGLQGGIKGNLPDLVDLDGNDNIRVRPEEDFRRIYSDFLKYRLGATDQDIEDVFGEYIDPYEVLRPVFKSVEDDYVKGGKEFGVSVWPNPSRGQSKIAFELKKSADVQLMVYSLDGRFNKQISNGRLTAGAYNFDLSMNQSGSFTVLLLVNGRRYSAKLSVIK